MKYHWWSWGNLSVNRWLKDTMLIWMIGPVLGESLQTRPEPENEIDKYAVAVTKDEKVIGHLKKGKTGRYAKTLFDFLRANPTNIANITVTGKRLSLGDREW